MASTLSAQVDMALRSCAVTGTDRRFTAAANGPSWISRSPIDGSVLASGRADSADDVTAAITAAHESFLGWRSVPAPVRGALIKRFGRLLEEHRDALATLVQLEVGKIRAEALGEVQEMIDICDFAVGLSRQLDGRTMPSERAGHRLMETWHPMGVVGVISAFNFPVAVWAWNTAIALVCGNSVVWKPSEEAPLCAIACSALLTRAIAEEGAPNAIHQLVVAHRVDGHPLVEDGRVSVLSATGSERMGLEIAPRVAARFGRVILELGGNNAAIVTPSADLDLATRAIVFAAAGTAGQRCTTLRRIIAHRSIVTELVEGLRLAYASLPVGSPLEPGTLVGPLISQRAFDAFESALAAARLSGGRVVVGGDRVIVEGESSYYVRPAVVCMPEQTDLVRSETFAPVLYVMEYDDFPEAIRLNNDVPQGLSSSIFTLDQREAETFLSSVGSDCGIANVNIGTSGAEIGGAFGGEKTTGGGRESGSDAWRAYMRRATNTINFSAELPLAQGITFG